MTQLLSYVPYGTRELRARSHAGRLRPIYGTKFEARRHKMFQNFHLLQSHLGFGIVNPFS